MMMMPKTNMKLKYNNSVAEVCINTSLYIFYRYRIIFIYIFIIIIVLLNLQNESI